MPVGSPSFIQTMVGSTPAGVSSYSFADRRVKATQPWSDKNIQTQLIFTELV